MQAGEAGLNFPIDSQAGLAGMIPTLTGATCTLVITSLSANAGASSRVVVDTRLVPTGDGRNFVYTTAAGDFPFVGTYDMQLVARFAGGIVRLSAVTRIPVLLSL